MIRFCHSMTSSARVLASKTLILIKNINMLIQIMFEDSAL